MGAIRNALLTAQQKEALERKRAQRAPRR